MNCQWYFNEISNTFRWYFIDFSETIFIIFLILFLTHLFVNMDFYRGALDLNDLKLEVVERESSGEWKFERLFIAPKDSNTFVSDRLLSESFSGGNFIKSDDLLRFISYYFTGFYYIQDQLKFTLPTTSTIPVSTVENARSFFESIARAKNPNDVKNLMEQTSNSILKYSCKDTFHHFQKEVVQNRLPDNLIDYLSDLYKKRDITRVNDEDTYRY